MKTKVKSLIHYLLQFGLLAVIATCLTGCVEQALIRRVKDLDVAYAQGRVPYRKYKVLRKKYVAEQVAYSAQLDRELAAYSTITNSEDPPESASPDDGLAYYDGDVYEYDGIIYHFYQGQFYYNNHGHRVFANLPQGATRHAASRGTGHTGSTMAYHAAGGTAAGMANHSVNVSQHNANAINMPRQIPGNAGAASANGGGNVPPPSKPQPATNQQQNKSKDKQ